MSEAATVNIKKQVNEIMEQKAKKILNEKKEQNIILKLVMNEEIENYSVDELKEKIINEKGELEYEE